MSGRSRAGDRRMSGRSRAGDRRTSGRGSAGDRRTSGRGSAGGSRISRRVTAGALVGRDFVRSRPPMPPLRTRAVGGLIAVACACALALTALRIDILRMRYALADAVQQERSLTLQRSQSTAQVETLRDPARLAELAAELGLSPPERVLELAPQTASRRQP